MKKNLLLSFTFIFLAALGICGVYLLVGAQPEENAHQIIKPRTEPLVRGSQSVSQEESKKVIEPIRKIPLKSVKAVSNDLEGSPEKNPAQKGELDAKKGQDIVPKVKTENPLQTKIALVSVSKSNEVNPQPKKEVPLADKIPNFIQLGNIIKFNQYATDYTVQPLDGEEEITLLGKLKTLKFSAMGGRSILDASALEVQEIILSGGVHGDSRVKLSAPQGKVVIEDDINGSSQVEINAPGGKVVFKGHSPAILDGGTKISIVARDVELNGEVRGSSHITVTLTSGGSLKFTRLVGGSRLHYSKAGPTDPEPRIEAGVVSPGTEFRKIERKK